MTHSPPNTRIDGDAPVAVGQAGSGAVVTAQAYSPMVAVGSQMLIAILFVLFFHVLMVLTLLLLPPLLIALSAASQRLGWMTEWLVSAMTFAILTTLVSGCWSYLLFRAGLRVTRDFPQGRSAAFMLTAFLAAPVLNFGLGQPVASVTPFWTLSIIIASVVGMGLAWRYRHDRSAAPLPRVASLGETP